MVLFGRKKKKHSLLENPKIIEPTPKIKPRMLTRIKITAGLGAVLVAALAWLLFFSPYFLVKDIIIEGEISDETKSTIEGLKGRNIFLVGGKKAEQELQQKQPWIKSIKIIRGVPDTVRVRLIERDAAFGWKTAEKTYLIDKEGVVFKEVADTKLPVIHDNRNVPVAFGQQVVTVDFIDFVTLLSSVVPLQTELKIAGLAVDETTFHVALATDHGFRILFDSLRPLQDQLDDFNAFYKEKKDEIKEYADMRVEGVVYYK